MKRGTLTALLVVLMLALASCSPGGEGTGADSTAGEGSSEAESSEDTSDGESIQDFIPGMPNFDPDAGEDQFRQQEQQAQENVQTCMAEQGFEYVPYVQSGQNIFADAETPEEYAELYGFGISFDLLNQPSFEEGEVPPEVADDPNFAIREELSPEEQVAYDQALYGAEPDIDFETMTDEEIDEYFQNWDPGGCYNDAYDELFGGQDSAAMAFYEEFGQDMEDLYQRAQSDPRIVELEQEWSNCMADAGYDFTDEQDANIYILRRLEEVGAISELEIDPNGGYGYGSEGPLEPGTDTYRAVEQIQEEEIEVALASTACRGDVETIYQDVYIEYEQEFIEENRAALEQFREEHS